LQGGFLRQGPVGPFGQTDQLSLRLYSLLPREPLAAARAASLLPAASQIGLPASGFDPPC
jgi:hypothetical protein